MGDDDTLWLLAVGWFFGLAMAVGGMFLVRRLLARVRGARGAVPVFDNDGPAAVNPAHPDLPDTVDATDAARIARIPHRDLRELVGALSTWKPRRHRAEDSFQRSFQAHLLKTGYAEEAITRHPRLRWTAEDRDPNSDDMRAVPDFSVKRGIRCADAVWRG
jgi:hypothetical protein